MSEQGSEQHALRHSSAGRAFLSFAQCVSELVDADSSWGSVGKDELHPMGWWPPRAITDFLLSSISGVSNEAAWSIDKRLRGNRALTPREVLALLQREGTTSYACAQATRLISDGRIGSAAHLLASEFIEAGGNPGSNEVAVLETIAQIQSASAHLGLSSQGDARLSMCVPCQRQPREGSDMGHGFRSLHPQPPRGNKGRDGYYGLYPYGRRAQTQGGN